jgi:hypothetical protein
MIHEDYLMLFHRRIPSLLILLPLAPEQIQNLREVVWNFPKGEGEQKRRHITRTQHIIDVS